MDQLKIVNQVVEFNKATLENTYNSICMVQEQAERMGELVLNQSTWLPEEGKKTLQDLIDTYKKGREDFKKNIDESFQKVEDFFLKNS